MMVKSLSRAQCELFLGSIFIWDFDGFSPVSQTPHTAVARTGSGDGDVAVLVDATHFRRLRLPVTKTILDNTQ
jgi:hypothetical protein